MKNKSQQLEKNKNQGFTLIEVMVSMSIFVMVVGMAVGTVIAMVDANAKAQNMQQAATNLSFALDSMSREIRTGTYYYGINSNSDGSNVVSAKNSNTRDCNGCTAMSFIEAGESLTASCTGSGSGRIAYRHQGTAIQRRICDRTWEDITAPNVLVDTFTFTVDHTDRTDRQSPLVTIFIDARVDGVALADASLQLQSSVTQQALDI